MKILILLLVLLFSCSLVFGENVMVSGFYIPITKTYATKGANSGVVVWTPASGKRIVLMGAYLSGGIDITNGSTIALQTAWNTVVSNGTNIVPATSIASGPIVIGTGAPIWAGDADATIVINKVGNFTPSVTLWGYEYLVP